MSSLHVDDGLVGLAVNVLYDSNPAPVSPPNARFGLYFFSLCFQALGPEIVKSFCISFNVKTGKTIYSEKEKRRMSSIRVCVCRVREDAMQRRRYNRKGQCRLTAPALVRAACCRLRDCDAPEGRA